MKIDFVEESYSVPEILTLISKKYGIEMREKGKTKRGKVNQRYRSMSQHIRRHLEGNELDTNSDKADEERRYSREIVDFVINKKLWNWILKYVDKARKQEYLEYKEKAAIYRQTVWSTLNTEGYPQGEQAETSEIDFHGLAMAEEVQEMKMAIVADFILKHCIEVDEELLAADINKRYTFDDMDPDADSLRAIDRLKDPANYYKVKEIPLKRTGTK